jgi:hypothetical protein
MRSPRLLLSVLLVPLGALATTIIPHTVAQRAQVADRVVLAQVLSQVVEEQPKGHVVPFKTLTRVVVGQDLKGRGPQELTIVQLGGRRGPETMEIPGDARFFVGETAVLFLTCRVAADRCQLVALGAGKLDVVGEHVLYQDLKSGAWQRERLADFAAALQPPRPAVPAAPAPAGVTR